MEAGTQHLFGKASHAARSTGSMIMNTAVEAGAVGIVAYARGSLDVAETAWRKAADSGHSEWALDAVGVLVWLFHERGEYERAEEAYQQAVDSGHSEWAPMAAGNLGILSVIKAITLGQSKPGSGLSIRITQNGRPRQHTLCSTYGVPVRSKPSSCRYHRSV